MTEAEQLDTFLNDGVNEMELESWNAEWKFPSAENQESVRGPSLLSTKKNKVSSQLLASLLSQKNPTPKHQQTRIPQEENERAEKDPEDQKNSKKIGLIAKKLNSGEANDEENAMCVEALSCLTMDEVAIEKLIQCSVIGRILEVMKKDGVFLKHGIQILVGVSTSPSGLRNPTFRKEGLPFLRSFVERKLHCNDSESMVEVEMALQVFQNASKDFDISEILVAPEGERSSLFLETFYRCLSDGKGKVPGAACKILIHSSYHNRFRQAMVQSGAVQNLLSYGNKIASSPCEDPHPNSEKSLGVLSVIRCLGNLCWKCPEGRGELKERKGLSLLAFVRESLEWKLSLELREACSVLVRALLSEALESDDWAEELRKWDGEEVSKVDEVSRLLNEAFKAKHDRGTTTTYYNNATEHKFLPPCDHAGKPMDIKHQLKMRPEVRDLLERMTVPPSPDKFYVKNEMWAWVGETGDVWTELWGEWRSLTDLKSIHIQKFVCAALNSRTKLSICFGIRQGKVKGITVDDESRDEFRVGIDCAMTRGFRPTVDPNLYSLAFVPVYVKTGPHSFQKQPNCFVVEFKIRHIATQLYQLLGGKVFLRIDGAPQNVSFAEARKFLAREMEKAMREEAGKMEEERRHWEEIGALRREVDEFRGRQTGFLPGESGDH